MLIAFVCALSGTVVAEEPAPAESTTKPRQVMEVMDITGEVHMPELTLLMPRKVTDPDPIDLELDEDLSDKVVQSADRQPF